MPTPGAAPACSRGVHSLRGADSPQLVKFFLIHPKDWPPNENIGQLGPQVRGRGGGLATWDVCETKHNLNLIAKIEFLNIS